MTNTAIQTGRLAVNAAFLKDIKDDNRELKGLMDRIDPLAKYPQMAINHWAEFAGLLADLCDQLAFHFSLEEAYGYVDDAIATAPQLSLVAECLRQQHGSMFEQIRDVADRAAAAGDQDGRRQGILDDFAKFRQAFEKHEEAELKLILDAVYDDIGVGD